VLIWLVLLLAGAPVWALWGAFALAGAMSVVAGADYLAQFLRRLPEMHAPA
jgi:hypothetical protein